MSAQSHPRVPPGVALLEAVNELRVAETLMTNRARARMGLGSSDFHALQYIAAHDSPDSPARAKDLMVILGVTAAAATIIADRLVQRGLIVRITDVEDRRSRILTLTNDARAAVTEVFGAFPDQVQAVLNDVGAADLERIRELATRVRTVLDRTAR